MAKLIFGLNQSLDGYVDHRRMAPDAGLFRHFIEQGAWRDRHALRPRHVRSDALLG